MGIPGIATSDQAKVDLGNKLLTLSLQRAALAFATGAAVTIENPASSMLWSMPIMLDFIELNHWQLITMDMCTYGSAHKKPTSFLCSSALFAPLARSCPGRSVTYT